MSTLFVVCFLVGLALSIVSFVSGLERVNVFEHLFGHLHLGHFAQHLHLGRGVGKVGHPTAQNQAQGDHGFSPLNAAAITAFLTWFGGAGMILEQTTRWPFLIVLVLSIVAGFAGGTLVNRFMRTLKRGERTAQPLRWEGTVATITIPIRKDGTGEIVFTHDGTRQVSGARSIDGTAISKGAEVLVTRYEKGIAYVCTCDELSAIES